MSGLPRVLSTARRRSAGLPFAATGLVFGTWASRIPEIQARTGLSDGALGAALLGSAVGLIVAALTAGAVIGRWGAHRATLAGAAALGVALVGPGLAVDVWSLAGALLVVGASMGLTDVAMNTWAADIEASGGDEILGACHGLFSLGGMAGAGVGAAAAAAGVIPAVHFAAVGLAGAAAVVAQGLPLLGAAPREATREAPRELTPRGAEAEPLIALPRGPVAGLAALAFCGLIVEGAIADWSGVFMAGALGAAPARAALGFAGFSAAMAAARFGSDRLTARLGGPSVGDRRLVRAGAALGALGLALAAAAPVAAVAVAGFTLAGLGLAGVVPALFRAASRAPGLAPGVGIAAVTGTGYLGFLVGPPAIGFAAEAAGMRWALGLPALLAALVAVGAVAAFRLAQSAAARPARTG